MPSSGHTDSPTIWEHISCNEAETHRIGQHLGMSAQAGSTLALSGNLGAGKTRLAKAVAVGLGVNSEDVTSPTFVLVQEYAGRLPVYHFDTYRLKDVDEFLDLGAEELLYGRGVCLVEWADRVADALPVDCLHLHIEAIAPTERELRFTARGEQSQAWLAAVRDGWSA